MVYIPHIVDQMVCGALHAACVGYLCFSHGHLLTLQYDRRDLNCAYFKRKEVPYNCIALTMVGSLVTSVLVAVVYQSAAPFLLHLIQLFCHLAALLGVDVGRQGDQRRLVSVRYMQHKYGLDADLLLQLLERHQLRHFPVAYYEEGWTIEQRDSYRADEEMRTGMSRLVQCDFILSLPDGKDCSSSLALFRSECNKTRQAVKLCKLVSDFYAPPKKETK
jgi:hypothetical protein